MEKHHLMDTLAHLVKRLGIYVLMRVWCQSHVGHAILVFVPDIWRRSTSYLPILWVKDKKTNNKDCPSFLSRCSFLPSLFHFNIFFYYHYKLIKSFSKIVPNFCQFAFLKFQIHPESVMIFV